MGQERVTSWLRMLSPMGGTWQYGSRALVLPLAERACREADRPEGLVMESAEQALIELPWSFTVPRTYQEIRIDTFRLLLPTCDFQYFYEELSRSMPERLPGGREFHRVSGWMSCLLLTSEQAGSVYEAMGDMLRTVVEEARVELVRCSESRSASWCLSSGSA